MSFFSHFVRTWFPAPHSFHCHLHFDREHFASFFCLACISIAALDDKHAHSQSTKRRLNNQKESNSATWSVSFCMPASDSQQQAFHLALFFSSCLSGFAFHARISFLRSLSLCAICRFPLFLLSKIVYATLFFTHFRTTFLQRDDSILKRI